MPQLHLAGCRSGSLASGVPMLLLLLGLLAGPARGAEPSLSQDQLWRGEDPRLVNTKLEATTRELCFAGFALLHFGISRTPLWSAEHLTAARVLVPTSLFKVAYDPWSGQAGAYLVPNASEKAWQAIPLARLTELAGIDPFPGLPAAVREHAMALPSPHGQAHGHAHPAHRATGRAAGSSVLDALKKLLQ